MTEQEALDQVKDMQDDTDAEREALLDDFDDFNDAYDDTVIAQDIVNAQLSEMDSRVTYYRENYGD